MKEKRDPYKPRGACEQLFYTTDRRVLLEGPARTGKSRAALEKIKLCALTYPKSRHLIIRKTRASLSESLLQTWEEFVLPKNLISGNASRAHRDKYVLPRESEVIVGGMDNWQRVMSAEYDTILYGEALESTADEVQTLITRLSNARMPYQQAIFDCNPGPPSHHLNVSANEGVMTRLKSLHTDNPRLYDEDGTITKFGEEYIGDLKRNKGHYYQRLTLGNWVAAEGVVYDQYSEDTHLIDQHDTPYAFYVAGADWGWNDAGVMQVWGVDWYGRSVLEYECYRTEKGIEYWINIARRIQQKYGPKRWLCDHKPEYLHQLRRAGVPAMRGHKDILHGLQVVQSRLLPGTDGRPRIYVKRGAREKPDKALTSKSIPSSTQEEFLVYSYPEKDKKVADPDKPLDKFNHGMDTMRYVQVYLDRYLRLDSRILLT